MKTRKFKNCATEKTDFNITIGKNRLTIISYSILLLACAIIEFWVLDSVTHDGRSSLDGLAVCTSNVGYAIDVYRFIEIGRHFKTMIKRIFAKTECFSFLYFIEL